MKTIIIPLIAGLLVSPVCFTQNVGIGNSNPIYARLMVDGNVGAAVAMFGADKFGVAIEANNPEIGFNYYFNNGTKTMKAGYAANIGMDPGNGNFYIGNFNNNQSIANFGDISGYQNVVTVTQAGKVGIRTSTPGSPLEIYNTTDNAGSGPGLRLTIDNSYGYNYWNIFPYDGGSLANYLYFSIGNTTKAGISGFNGSYFTVSDRNCKKDIVYFKDGSMLGKLMELKPATYLMKEEPGTNIHEMGFISQDVETIFPTLVSNTGGIKMMNYSGLIPVAIQGIKEQQEEIQSLQKENAEMKKMMADLIAKLPAGK
jgi:hypothetical protein